MSVNSKIFEWIAEIEERLEKIKGELAIKEFRTPDSSVSMKDAYKPKAAADLPPVEYTAPPATELQKAGIDVSLLDFLEYGNRLKVKKWLDRPIFDELNRLLTAEGYRYDYEKKEWTFQPHDSKQERSQPQKAAPAKDKSTKVTRISDLREGMKSPTIEGHLLDDPVQKDVNTRKGPSSVTNFRLDDGTGEARVSLWGDLANSAMGLVLGDKVQITSLMVKTPYDGLPQVQGGNWSKVIKL